MFANSPGDLGSVPGCVIPKTLKMVLDTSLLNTQQIRYVSRVKCSNPGKGVAPSPIPLCSSYWKGSLLITLNYGCQLLLTYFVIYWFQYIIIKSQFPQSPVYRAYNTLIVSLAEGLNISKLGVSLVWPLTASDSGAPVLIWVPFYYYYFLVHLWPWIVEPVRVSSMYQIDLF